LRQASRVTLRQTRGSVKNNELNASMPRFWGGASDGEQCDVCDTRITKEQLVMEGIASVFTNKKPVQFHVQCFYAWDAERRVPQT